MKHGLFSIVLILQSLVVFAQKDFIPLTQEELLQQTKESLQKYIDDLEADQKAYLNGERNDGGFGGIIRAEGGMEMLKSARASDAAEYTTTNNQEEGIEELDTVKNTDRHIYQIKDNSVTITSIDGDLTHLATIKVDNTPSHLLLDDVNDILVVFSTRYEHRLYSAKIAMGGCIGPMGGGETIINVYDIAKKSAPALKAQYTLHGSLRTVRRHNEHVYVVMNRNMNALIPSSISGLGQYSLLAEDFSKEEKLALLEQKMIKNREIVKNLRLTDFDKGFYIDAVDAAGARTKVAAKTILAPEDQSKRAFDLDLIFSFNTKNFEPNASAILPEKQIYFFGGAIYMSEKALYLVRTKGDWNDQTSLIDRFEIKNGFVHYAGTGEVKGTIQNQFVLDEHSKGSNVYLRVATTVASANETTNRVSIFLANEGGLELVGQTPELAKGEHIYSVRYRGDMAYVVTFRQVDPLFSIDLSDVSNPKVLGELKIPGFSNYMHFIDDNHILGIGSHATDEGRVVGAKLSLFDVTDKSNPVEQASFMLSAGSYSAGAHNHKDFIFYKAKGILGIPVTTYDGIETLQSVNLFKIRPDSIHQIGRFLVAQNYSLPGRAIFVGNMVYVVDQKSIKSYDLSDLTTQTGELALD